MKVREGSWLIFSFVPGKGAFSPYRTYSDLKPDYHLSFLCGNLYPDRYWFHRFVYYDPERRVKMGGRTEIVTVELKKLENLIEDTVEDLDIREVWGLYMMYHRDNEKTETIQKIITMDEGIAAADQVVRGFTQTELEGLAAIARDRYEFDRREELHEMKLAIRAEAHAEGHAEGHAEAMKGVARKLKAMGTPLEQIIEISGLSAELIECL